MAAETSQANGTADVKTVFLGERVQELRCELAVAQRQIAYWKDRYERSTSGHGTQPAGN